MRIQSVSGDMLIKLAIVAGAAVGVWYIVGKASDAVGNIGVSIGNAAAAALDSVAGAVEGPGFGSTGLTGMWVNGAYQYDVSAFDENARAAAEAAISAVRAAVVPGPDSVAGMFVSAQLAVADFLTRAIEPVNKPWTGEVPNIEINSWR